jgi:protein-S-isoprenylcysteine O-methyltransferase Ste14
MWKRLSAVSLLLMIVGAVSLVVTHAMFSANIAVVAVQAVAFALMVWARLTFGRRSFHATADPTEGGLVTTGPYRFVRHPIYASICLFLVAGALAHLSPTTVVLVLLALIGAAGRILAEEHLLVERYPEYADYAARTKRLVPYVF